MAICRCLFSSHGDDGDRVTYSNTAAAIHASRAMGDKFSFPRGTSFEVRSLESLNASSLIVIAIIRLTIQAVNRDGRDREFRETEVALFGFIHHPANLKDGLGNCLAETGSSLCKLAGGESPRAAVQINDR